MTQEPLGKNPVGEEFSHGGPQCGRYSRYGEYKHCGVDGLGAVPSHWAVKKVTQLFSIGSGTTPPTDYAEYYGGEIPWITTSELRESVVSSTEKTITKRALKTFPALNVYPVGSVAVAMYGATIGRLGILGTSAAVNQACCVFNMPKGIDAWFWFYWLQSRRSYLISLGYGGGQPNLNQELLKSIRVPTPPLDEQRAIASFLDRETARIDALVAKKERLIELLQEKRAALIARVVTKGLDSNVSTKDSDVEWLAKLPAHWELNRVKHVSTFVTSGSRGWANYYTDEGPLFLRIGNLHVGCIDLDLEDAQHVSPPKGTEGERTRVKPGDILISITALIGAVAVVNDDVSEAYVNQHLALLRPMASRIESRWLAHSLASIVGQAQLQEALYGGTKDGLGLEDIRSLLILSPPLCEQRATAAFLDRETAKIAALIAKVRDAIGYLKELRTALISAAVTGKIDVREDADPSLETAS